MRTIRLFTLWAGMAAALLLSSCEKAISPTGGNHQQPDPLAVLKAQIIRAADSIQTQVAAFRGKSFIRTVYVSVFTQSQYAALVGDQIDTMSQSEKDLYNRVFRLEGLLRPNADYFSSYDSTLSSETAGFYVPGTDSMYIILGDSATGLTFDDSLTIFHEFVHALQDQYFDLSTIDNQIQAYPTDEYWAADYMIEGEAELMENYYYLLLWNGAYPTTTTPVLNLMNQDQIYTDQELDSMHQAGVPLLSTMPTLWEYYSYGPRFINAIAGMTWSIIDNTIFPAPPMRMLEVLHPQEYSTANEYELNTSNLENAVVSTANNNTIVDEDELGELFADVMFREWNFSAYKNIPNGMMADNVIIYEGQADSLRMIWNTYWQDSTACDTFFQNYIQLVNLKRNIQLPAAVDSPAYAFVNDTINNIYIEQSKSYVFTIENYQTSELSGFITQCRALLPYSNVTLAKAQVLRKTKYPHLNRHLLTGGKTHPIRRPWRPIRKGR